jgi:hypothetical protein
VVYLSDVLKMEVMVGVWGLNRYKRTEKCGCSV